MVSPMASNSGCTSHSSASTPRLSPCLMTCSVTNSVGPSVSLAQLGMNKVHGGMGALTTADKVTFLPDDSPFSEYTDVRGQAHIMAGRGEREETRSPQPSVSYTRGKKQLPNGKVQKRTKPD